MTVRDRVTNRILAPAGLDDAAVVAALDAFAPAGADLADLSTFPFLTTSRPAAPLSPFLASSS